MSIFVAKFVGVMASAALVTGGSYWVYKNNLPRDLRGILEREGYAMAFSDVAFKSLFFDNKFMVSELLGSGLSSANSLEEAGPKLKKWCEDQYKRQISDMENLEKEKVKVLKFCEDKALTVKGKLIRIGKNEFLEEMKDEDYKVLYVLYRSESEFMQLLKAQDSLFNESSGNDKGKVVLREWCNKNFSLNPKEVSNISLRQISWYCAPLGYKTVGEKLAKESLEKVDDSGWGDLFDTWKNTNELIEAVKKHSSDLQLGPGTEKSLGGNKLKAWCEFGLTRNLYDEGVYPSEYRLIRSVCIKKGPKVKG